MNATTTVAAHVLRFARLPLLASLLALGFAAALTGSAAPVAADSLRALIPTDQSGTAITIGRPDFSLAQPGPADGAAYEIGNRLPNELPALRMVLQRFAREYGIEFRSDLVGSCIGLCTTRPSGTGDAA